MQKYFIPRTDHIHLNPRTDPVFDPVRSQDLPDLLRPPGRTEPLLGADQSFDLVGRAEGDGFRCPVALLQGLHSALRVACNPLVARLAADAETSAQLRHGEMAASSQTDKSLFLFHG